MQFIIIAALIHKSIWPFTSTITLVLPTDFSESLPTCSLPPKNRHIAPVVQRIEQGFPKP